MNLSDMSWLHGNIDIFGKKVPVDALLYTALALLVLLLIIVAVRVRKRCKIDSNTLGTQDSPPEAESSAETSPKDDKERSQVVSDGDKPDSQLLEEKIALALCEFDKRLDNRLRLFYTLMPELQLIESLEDFKAKGITTLDLREKVESLLKVAGALETVLEPRSIGRRKVPSNNAPMIEHLRAKIDEIDKAYMSRVFRPEHYLAIGCFYYHKHLFDKAIEYFDKAIEANHYNTSAWGNKAAAFMEIERYDEALECYTKALENAPDNPLAWFGKGLILCDTGEYEEGIKCLQRALELRPLWAEAWYERGLVLSAQESFHEALQSFENAIIMNPEDERFWQAKGIAHSYLGMHELAYRAYEQALSIKPKNEEAWYGRSITLSYLGMYEEAIRSFDFVLSINKNNYKAWYGRGLAHLYLKRYDYALESFRNSTDINGSYAKAWYNMAIVHGLQGNREGSLEALQRAISIDKKFKLKAKNSEDFSQYRNDEAFAKLWSDDNTA